MNFGIDDEFAKLLGKYIKILLKAGNIKEEYPKATKVFDVYSKKIENKHCEIILAYNYLIYHHKAIVEKSFFEGNAQSDWFCKSLIHAWMIRAKIDRDRIINT